MAEPQYVPFTDRYQPSGSPEAEGERFHDVMRRRRSVRMFADTPVSREAIEWLVRTAGTAPSGANKQPWRFVCVQDPGLKRQIRIGAEKEEVEFYSRRASQRWLDDLAPLGTDENKEFLEIAPWLIIVFKLMHDDDEGQVYYTNESVGIASGMLITAVHLAGLTTLTHTPSPMRFLREILGRPENERPFLLLPVGYAAEECVVPVAAIGRKPLEQIMVVDRGGGSG